MQLFYLLFLVNWEFKIDKNFHHVIPQVRVYLKREIEIRSISFFFSRFFLLAVLITNLYNIAMNWMNRLNYMTNVTIHRQPTLLLFHNSIWLSNPNYAKFFYPKYIFLFFLFSWTLTYFFEPRIQNYGSHLKSIFIFFFYQLLENENLFPRCYVPELKMTCQWKDKYIFTDWEVLTVEISARGQHLQVFAIWTIP